MFKGVKTGKYITNFKGVQREIQEVSLGVPRIVFYGCFQGKRRMFPGVNRKLVEVGKRQSSKKVLGENQGCFKDISRVSV